MLKFLKVYKYQSSGELIADLEKGYVFPLNSDLTFSQKVPQRISHDATLESTRYRIEVEIGTKDKHKAYHIIRTWEVNPLKALCLKVLNKEAIDRNVLLPITRLQVATESENNEIHIDALINKAKTRTDVMHLLRLLEATEFEINKVDIDALINIDYRPPRSADPHAPIENRIEISMSAEFSEAERQYVGQSDSHPVGFMLMIASFFLFIMAGFWGWWPPILAFATGVIVIWSTKNSGNSSKIKEVRDAKERLRTEERNAKERLRKHEEKRRREAMHDVQFWAALSGVEFEQAVARIFREKGFEVELTPRSNDKGVDLILKKDGAVSIVQCKAYKKNVGVSAVRELIGVRASWPNVEEAILVTLFDFSSVAKELAIEHNIKLLSIAKDYLKTDYRPKY